jgi:cbb3-type cytochrome oxidase subunit 3
MNFDQMMDAWKGQDDTPLYGVNRDLLALVVLNEQADIRRAMRIEKWTTYGVGTAMAVLAGGLLWMFPGRGEGSTVAVATLALVACAVWMIALWASRRGQALRERGFGNSLNDEVRRSLSLVDYQLSQAGRWTRVLLWSAPVTLGACLILWLIMAVNRIDDPWMTYGPIIFVVTSIAWQAFDTSSRATRELTPRRERLNELLGMIERA